MVAKLKDILDVLEELAPSYTAEEWDNPGLQVGYFSQAIKKIFVAVDPSLKAIRKASNRDSQLLLTHHPLIFNPISHINQGNYPGNVIFEAFKKGISVVAAHTNLDVIWGGINDMLADLFELQEVELLEKRADLKMDDAGLGRIGYLPNPMRLSGMAETVKAILGTERIRVVGHKNMRVKRVAVVGGSGGGMISVASKKGADLLVTGDVSHHGARDAENLGLALIDGGHFHTEKAALRLFSGRLKDSFIQRGLDVIVEFYKDERDPMRYE